MKSNPSTFLNFGSNLHTLCWKTLYIRDLVRKKQFPFHISLTLSVTQPITMCIIIRTQGEQNWGQKRKFADVIIFLIFVFSSEKEKIEIISYLLENNFELVYPKVESSCFSVEETQSTTMHGLKWNLCKVFSISQKLLYFT